MGSGLSVEVHALVSWSYDAKEVMVEKARRRRRRESSLRRCDDDGR